MKREKEVAGQLQLQAAPRDSTESMAPEHPLWAHETHGLLLLGWPRVGVQGVSLDLNISFASDSQAPRLAQPGQQKL